MGNPRARDYAEGSALPGLTSSGEEGGGGTGAALAIGGEGISPSPVLLLPLPPSLSTAPVPRRKVLLSSRTHVDAYSSPVIALSPQTNLAQPRVVSARIFSDEMQRRGGGARAAFSIRIFQHYIFISPSYFSPFPPTALFRSGAA